MALPTTKIRKKMRYFIVLGSIPPEEPGRTTIRRFFGWNPPGTGPRVGRPGPRVGRGMKSSSRSRSMPGGSGTVHRQNHAGDDDRGDPEDRQGSREDGPPSDQFHGCEQLEEVDQDDDRGDEGRNHSKPADEGRRQGAGPERRPDAGATERSRNRFGVPDDQHADVLIEADGAE